MDTTGKIAVGSTVGVAVIVGSIFALLWPRRSYAFQRNLSWKKTITDGEELYADIQDLKGKAKSYINEYKTLDLNDQKAVGKYKARLKTDVIDPFKSVGKKLDLSTWDKYNVRPYILGVGNVMSELSRLPQVKRSSPSVEKKKEGFGPSSLAEQLKRRKAELMKGRGRKTTKQGRKLSLAEQIKTQRAKLKKAGSRKTRTRKKQTVLEKRREAMKGKYSSGEDDGDFSSSDF